MCYDEGLNRLFSPELLCLDWKTAFLALFHQQTAQDRKEKLH